MARPLRIEYRGACYHVMNRGNNGQDVFLADTDRHMFLDGLSDSLKIYGVRLIAYVLMANHFHLIVKTRRANLSEFMRHFLVTYTVRFNKKWKRSGHVFEGRYKSFLVEEGEYLLRLSRFIHLNPIRTEEFEGSKLHAKETCLRNYEWSTLPGYCSLKKRDDMADYRWFMETCFKGDKPHRRQRYWNYVIEGIRGTIADPFREVLHQTVLGSSDFVGQIKKKISWDMEREVPSIRKFRRSVPAEKIIGIVADFHGVKADDIVKRKTKEKIVRQTAMELCYRYSPMTQKDIGEIFGIDYSTVSRNRKRLKDYIGSDNKMKKKFDRIEYIVARVAKQTG